MNAPLPAHLLPRLEPRAVPAEMIEALKATFGERCSTARAVREQHGRDESPIDAPPPEAVVFCESTEDVAAVILALLDEPRTAGLSLDLVGGDTPIDEAVAGLVGAGSSE